MNYPGLIQQLTLENFTLFRTLPTPTFYSTLNVIIGENDTGKTHLLKLLYTIVRSLEEYQNQRPGTSFIQLSDLLANKLQRVFLPPQMELGQLVSKGEKRLTVTAQLQGERLQFTFGKDTKNQIKAKSFHHTLDHLGPVKAIFLPSTEILSFYYDAIIATREALELSTFDDTYLDLAHNFHQPVVMRNHWRAPLKKSWQSLNQTTGGYEIVVEKDGSIWFLRGQERYNIHQVAEGTKKIALLNQLMRKGMLWPSVGKVLFIDEPELHLHPKAIVLLAEFLFQLSETGIQVYLSTYSYFMLKRLEQLARRDDKDCLLIDLRHDRTGAKASYQLLKDGLPDNPIAEQSVALYQEDVNLYLTKSTSNKNKKRWQRQEKMEAML